MLIQCVVLNLAEAHRIVEDVKYTVHKAESEAIHVAHVVEEEAKQAYHKIEDETRQVYDKVSHSDQVKQISSATADALAKGKAVTDDLVKQAHEASSDAAHQVKVMSGHLLEDVCSDLRLQIVFRAFNGALSRGVSSNCGVVVGMGR